MNPVAIDFETLSIEGRPRYPPKPVGVSILVPGKKAEYYAFGHPVNNNCTKEVAKRELKRVWGEALVFHHGKFDVDIAETHMGMKTIPWERCHDTLFLAFLHDPHSPSFALKPLAERHLGLKAGERDLLRDWILRNVTGSTMKNWGAFIHKAPGDLVGKYANGDTGRTLSLFMKLHADIIKRGMLGAYNREQRLMPILLETEREGVCVNMARLRKDVTFYGGRQVGEEGGKPVYNGGVLGQLDDFIRKRLKAPKLDVAKGGQLAQALLNAKALSSVINTPTGKVSTAKEALLEGIDDKKLLAVLLYRGALATCVQTFMRPWLRQAEETGGRIHTTWNQVRQSDYEGDLAGARTGRLSSSPNFQNIPIRTSPNYERLIVCLKEAKLLDRFAPFPMVRSYLAPDPGGVFLNRDFSQQELRILGHYEGGVLRDQYIKDPWLDIHDLAGALINDMLGTSFIRRVIKDVGFALIYGLGTPKLAKKIDQDTKTAARIKQAYLEIFPGLAELDRELKARAASKKPVRTWGGREYYCEEPSFSEKFQRWMTYEYKLLNQLIQGSAADNTKQAIINYHQHPKRTARFILSVHDEVLASTSSRLQAHIRNEMHIMKEAIEACRFDVPMLSEGEYGADWADLETFDEKGQEVFKCRQSR